MNEYRVQVFPKLASSTTVGVGMTKRDFADKESAESHRKSLIDSGVEDCNIRIVKINADGVTVPFD
jgi:hypothetical protein